MEKEQKILKEKEQEEKILNYRQKYLEEQKQEEERIKKENEKTKLLKENLTKDQIYYKYKVFGKKFKFKFCLGILEIPSGIICEE